MKPEKFSKVSRETADHYVWGERCDGWHLLKSAGLSVIEECMPPGTSELRHFHHRAQQFFYLLSGEAMMEVSGQNVSLQPGQGIWIPAGATHQIRNVSEADVRFLVISQPPSHGDREVVSEV